MADGSPRTDTSTDVDTDEKNQRVISCSLSSYYCMLTFFVLWVLIFILDLYTLVTISYCCTAEYHIAFPYVFSIFFSESDLGKV